MNLDDTITGVGMTGPITLTAPSFLSSSTALKLNAGSGPTLTGAVGEVLLLRVAAQIGEGQHRDRRLVQEREAGARGAERLV
jgi:hypothetical protein